MGLTVFVFVVLLLLLVSLFLGSWVQSSVGADCVLLYLSLRIQQPALTNRYIRCESGWSSTCFWVKGGTVYCSVLLQYQHPSDSALCLEGVVPNQTGEEEVPRLVGTRTPAGGFRGVGEQAGAL